MRKDSTFKTVNIRDMTMTALCVALMAVCAWITLPFPIPFTMQTFAVFVSVGLMGTKRGTIAVLLYILLGAVGLPVFSGMKGGIGVLLGMTGGYIIGFLFSAIVTGVLTDRFGRKKPVMFFAMLAGLFVCYAFGSVWFYLVYLHTAGEIGSGAALVKCVVPFLLPDAAKIMLAVLVTAAVSSARERKDGK